MSDQSDTPETDAAHWDIRHDDGTTEEVVNADFARKLERERGAARAEIAELRKDKARLDYMQHYAASHNGHWLHVGDGGLVSTTDDIRQAIDAVMEGGEG